MPIPTILDHRSHRSRGSEGTATAPSTSNANLPASLPNTSATNLANVEGDVTAETPADQVCSNVNLGLPLLSRVTPQTAIASME